MIFISYEFSYRTLIVYSSSEQYKEESRACFGYMETRTIDGQQKVVLLFLASYKKTDLTKLFSCARYFGF